MGDPVEYELLELVFQSGATPFPSVQCVPAPAGRLSERANTTQEHIDEAAI